LEGFFEGDYMEYFDLYDKYGNSLNKQALRGHHLKEGEFFKVIHVWIENDQGEFLIQQRAKSNDPIPYQWAITSGIPDQGESAIDAAIRETKEEIGITLDKQELKRIARIVSSHNKYNTITFVYHIYANLSINEMTLNEKEVLQVKYACISEILEMVENQEFWDYKVLLGEPNYFSLIRRR